MNPFDFVNAINYGKEDLFKDNPSANNEYNQFIVNRALSYFQDTVMHANEMNRYHHISNQMQFDFLRHTIGKRKRFSKWAKKQPPTDTINIIKEVYNYSDAKAMEVVDLLDNNKVRILEETAFKGGLK
jgi:hypothetical protein